MDSANRQNQQCRDTSRQEIGNAIIVWPGQHLTCISFPVRPRSGPASGRWIVMIEVMRDNTDAWRVPF
jgi:hypothetical protein